MPNSTRTPLWIGLAAGVIAAAATGFWIGRSSGTAPLPPDTATATAGKSSAVPPSSGPAAEPAAEPTRVGDPPVPNGAPIAASRPRAVAGARRVSAAPSATEEMAAEPPSSPAAEATETSPNVAPKEPAWVSVTVPEGTEVKIRLRGDVSSQTAAVGDEIEGELAEAVVADGRVALPEGSSVHGVVRDVQALKKIGGQARLTLDFESVEVEGQRFTISAEFTRSGKSETGKDAATIAAGTIIGTILGNQTGHGGRGRLVGGLLGAGAGTAIAAETKGQRIELPRGTILQLHLKTPVELQVPNR